MSADAVVTAPEGSAAELAKAFAASNPERLTQASGGKLLAHGSSTLMILGEAA